MADRPTPEQIADGICTSGFMTRSLCMERIADAIRAERAEADRRVEKQRLAGLVAGNEAVRREVDRWGKRLEEERARGDALERASHHLAGQLTELEAELREERTSRVLEERAKERAAVVHHLRSGSKSSDWDEVVREIERGEHRK